MAGELTNTDGASGWVQVATGLALTADTLTQASTSDFATLLAAVEADYPRFQARLQVTTGTPTENSVVDFHFRMGDGTNQEPAPLGSYAPHFRGNIVLDNTASSFYFSDTMSLDNKNATLYLRSDDALTVTLHIKAITFKPAA